MEKSDIRFGLITDVHYDLMYQANDRLETFIKRANDEQVDFIIQLGDFCFPKPENKEFLQTWEKFKGQRYHVLGNHDMDHCDKKTIMDFLGMEYNYYSFDHGDYHFVVLDANYLNLDGQYIDYSYGNYFKYREEAKNNITDEQYQWLTQDLASTTKPTMIFSHQSLENPYVGVKTSDTLHRLFKDINEVAGCKKVFACMNGHNHLDGVKVIEDIYFIHMNSSSYVWLGAKYNTTSYTEEIRDEFPILKHSVPYQDPLYAIITLRPNELIIEGKESEFVEPAPFACGHSNVSAGHVLVPKISDRRLKY
ncbi:hypothetical protein J14TS2_52110 [Bacillus sp. J14TS2]|uniref:metallophosphoesterase family protein n=1 Tax=Bacillus sp. J14TS2 TaxID=2807188 RepID=UPI001B23B332|nr:metallophosphoesterase [Bacillus sp. J14TS2]GIN74736.1 hypothetical protein J14TS2_52110 [Bacillus sp. J14TS2]